MRNFLILLTIFISATVLAQNLAIKDSELKVIEKGGKYGYKNIKTGKIVIKPQFDYAQDFSEGLAVVEVNGKWGFINKTFGETDKFVIEPQFDYAQGFSEGLAAVCINKKFGFINKTFGETGDFVIEPQFDYAWNFSEGLAAVCINEKWGFISKTFGETGDFVIKPQFYWADSFSEGFAAACMPVDGMDRKWGYIDRYGKVVIEPQFDYAGPFSNGLARVRIDYGRIEEWKVINKEGRFIIYPELRQFFGDIQDFFYEYYKSFAD